MQSGRKNDLLKGLFVDGNEGKMKEMISRF